MIPIRIVSTGSYLPKKVVTAEELDVLMEAEPGWTLRKTGVAKRHYADGETASEMGAAAARVALAKASLSIKDIDVIVGTSASMEQLLPSNGALLAEALGPEASGIPCLDINATCLSFAAGLDTVSYLVAAGRYRRALLVSSEIASIGLNRKHKESCALFGDGAAAVIIEKSDEEGPGAPGILASRFETYAEGVHLCEIPGGGSKFNCHHKDFKPEDATFHMEGPKVFEMASRVMPGFFDRLYSGLNFTLGDAKLVIPHQASLPALKLIRRKLKLGRDQFSIFVEERGNMIAASLPTGLHLAIEEGKIKRGDIFALIGTAAGFTIGGLVMRY